MTLENWLAIAAIAATLIAAILPRLAERWIPVVPQNATKKEKSANRVARSANEREIKRIFLLPAWGSCLVSLGMLVWNLIRDDPLDRSDVLAIVLYTFMLIFSIMFVLFAHAVVAISRVVERAEEKKSSKTSADRKQESN